MYRADNPPLPDVRRALQSSIRDLERSPGVAVSRCCQLSQRANQSGQDARKTC